MVGGESAPWSKVGDFEPIFARSASAITPSEKFQLTLIKIPLFALKA